MAASTLVALSVLSGLHLTAATAQGTEGKGRPPGSTTTSAPTTTSTAPERRPTELSTFSTFDPIVVWICGGVIMYPCLRDSRTYYATLTAGGEPVVGARLTFYRTNGSFLCGAATNDFGSASCSYWNGGLPNPTYDTPYTVVFVGDDEYAPSSADGDGPPVG